jgi:hypothetical protein
MNCQKLAHAMNFRGKVRFDTGRRFQGNSLADPLLYQSARSHYEYPIEEFKTRPTESNGEALRQHIRIESLTRRSQFLNFQGSFPREPRLRAPNEIEMPHKGALMKTFSCLAIAIFSLVSVSAFAADVYTCTSSQGTGIYNLTLDAGTATLVVDGVSHTAHGAGEYIFTDSFSIGDVTFNSPTLDLPMDGTTSDIQFTATLSDSSGSSGAHVDLNCSH